VIRITRHGVTSHDKIAPGSAKLNILMDEYGILHNRKRVLIALIHSVIFLGVAMHGFVSPKAGIVGGRGRGADFALLAVYLVVAAILSSLVSISRCLIERAYFALCAGSVTFAAIRTIFGDSTVPFAQYLRFLSLCSAVAIGVTLLRSSSTRPQELTK
jgi:hypothetical protein